MKNKLLNGLITTVALMSLACSLSAQTKPDTWTAQDALGRKMESAEQYGTPRAHKTVGMFYVLWHGTHGYDSPVSTPPDEGVVVPSPSDTCSPYDIQKMLDANPANPQYGPVHAFHHWGEPYMDYYVSNDEWVIRKHAQMLSDAGVDVIIFDVTNAVLYMPTLLKLCEVYTQMRAEGNRTPQLSFLLFAEADRTLKRLYDGFFAKGLYKELWFDWKGKPLIFCPFSAKTPEYDAFFTFRSSWFCTDWEFWFGDGRDRCAWADFYPQRYGWTENPGVPEMISVAPATHPTDRKDGVKRIGRSYHNGVQPLTKAEQRTGEGLHFSEQFSRAMQVDPEFIFFTGWNEWTAMRFINQGEIMTLADNVCKIGDSYFCDDYNHEYSRDLEPLRGDFGDNYYYQLVDFIRRYKGVEPQAAYSGQTKVSLDDMGVWNGVEAAYTDDKGDVFHRDHFGYGRVGQLVNTTGRNDFLTAKVANDGKNLYFYVHTDKAITPRTDAKWMRLFIDVKGARLGDWEGFQYMVNGNPTDDRTTSLQICRNGWNWAAPSEVEYRVNGNEMVIAVPLAALGIKDPNRFSLDFKWIDNAVEDGDIQECLTDGDAAPNGRFRYRYTVDK